MHGFNRHEDSPAVRKGHFPVRIEALAVNAKEEAVERAPAVKTDPLVAGGGIGEAPLALEQNLRGDQ